MLSNVLILALTIGVALGGQRRFGPAFQYSYSASHNPNKVSHWTQTAVFTPRRPSRLLSPTNSLPGVQSNRVSTAPIAKLPKIVQSRSDFIHTPKNQKSLRQFTGSVIHVPVTTPKSQPKNGLVISPTEVPQENSESQSEQLLVSQVPEILLESQTEPPVISEDLEIPAEMIAPQTETSVTKTIKAPVDIQELKPQTLLDTNPIIEVPVGLSEKQHEPISEDKASEQRQTQVATDNANIPVMIPVPKDFPASSVVVSPEQLKRIGIENISSVFDYFAVKQDNISETHGSEKFAGTVATVEIPATPELDDSISTKVGSQIGMDSTKPKTLVELDDSYILTDTLQTTISPIEPSVTLLPEILTETPIAQTDLLQSSNSGSQTQDISYEDHYKQFIQMWFKFASVNSNPFDIAKALEPVYQNYLNNVNVAHNEVDSNTPVEDIPINFDFTPTTEQSADLALQSKNFDVEMIQPTEEVFIEPTEGTMIEINPLVQKNLTKSIDPVEKVIDPVREVVEQKANLSTAASATDSPVVEPTRPIIQTVEIEPMTNDAESEVLILGTQRFNFPNSALYPGSSGTENSPSSKAPFAAVPLLTSRGTVAGFRYITSYST